MARQPAVAVGRWRWLLVVSLLAQMVVTLGRGILGAFFTESYPTFLAPHPVNYAFAVIANATTVLVAAWRCCSPIATRRRASSSGSPPSTA